MDHLVKSPDPWVGPGVFSLSRSGQTCNPPHSHDFRPGRKRVTDSAHYNSQEPPHRELPAPPCRGFQSASGPWQEGGRSGSNGTLCSGSVHSLCPSNSLAPRTRPGAAPEPPHNPSRSAGLVFPSPSFLMTNLGSAAASTDLTSVARCWRAIRGYSVSGFGCQSSVDPLGAKSPVYPTPSSPCCSSPSGGHWFCSYHKAPTGCYATRPQTWKPVVDSPS
ncbi:uncharacterized protein [Vicugna pacos]|uniref:Uncharacterized protein n=1 Tax=Vicugna pacos TaxID=30538 RepID=A0ABM5DU38_VICPA